MVNGDVISLINACLRMAEHPNSNEHEAAMALERAQKLLLEHNLTMAQVRENGTKPSPPGIGKIENTEATGFSWKSSVLHVIAVNSLCDTVGDSRTNTSHLFGSYDNVRMVLEMYHWICPQLEDMAMRGWEAYRKDGTGRESIRTWKNGFFTGATNVISDRLKVGMSKFAETTGRDLIIYNKQALSSAVKRVFPRTVKSHSTTTSNDGYVAGRAAGGKVQLTPRHKITGTLALR